MIKNFEQIIECVRSGIISTENGNFRKFDSIDLLLMINQTPTCAINYIRQVCGHSDLTKFQKLLGDKVKGISVVSDATISYLKSIDYSVKGYTFTDEDKDFVINYLLNTLPAKTFNEYIYFLGLRKYLNGDFKIKPKVSVK